ncbi:MAG: Gfo/Idh/MocA family oxidoreductase [Verrucomicrobiota bacterium]
MALDRRQFIKKGSVLGAGSIFIPSIIKAQNLNNEKVRIAIIGVGGRGSSHVRSLSKIGEIVAFCDVNEKFEAKPSSYSGYKSAVKTYADFPDIPRYKDYRVMFDKMGNQFDAVSVAVPDHMHYPIALWAMAAGKHLLMEKPLVRTFSEAMHLKKVAQETGVITQMGNQGHANEGVRLIQEWIDGGVIGDVSEVYHWTNRPLWPQGMAQFQQTTAVPDGIDWNLWQGIAPSREYSPGIAPFDWRGYRDYGCGAIGDIACHCMDASYTPLGLSYPTSIEAVNGKMTDVAFPQKSQIDFEFKTKAGQNIKLHWMDGNIKPGSVPFVPDDYFKGGGSKGATGTGTFIVGSKGTLFSDIYSKSIGILPMDYFMDLKKSRAFPPKTLPRVKGGHFKEWVEAIKNNKQPGSNFADYAADFTGVALLGTVALDVEGKLEFDENKKEFTNNKQANELLKSNYEYRSEFIPEKYV